MLTAWFHHRDFGKLVTQAWADPEHSLLQSMASFRQLAVYCNKTCFGNIFDRKRRCQARLEGVQRRLALYRSSYLANLESALVDELNSLLWLEEEFWKQKAKIAWIIGGE